MAHSNDSGGRTDRRQFLKQSGAVTAAVRAGSTLPARAADDPKNATMAPLPSNPRTPSAMPTRNLGKTGYKVGLFSLGGQASLEKANNFDAAVPIIERALDLGVNYIDTSSIYGGPDRWSEQYVGKVMAHRRNEAFLATKTKERTREGSLRMIEKSLQLLNTDHVDLWQLHDIGTMTDVNEIFAKGGAMEALLEMQEQKVVRYLGVSNHAAWHIAKSLGISERRGLARFESVQAYYSIAGRELEREIVPLANDQRLAIMPWSPLAGGFLSGKYTRNNEKAGDSRRDSFDFPPVNKEKAYDIIDVIAEIGKQHNVSAAQIALAWVRLQKGVTSTIIGAKNPDQLQDNIKSTELVLSADDLKKIDEVSALPREYPGWMVERQSADRELK